ncbi:hypothetical protein JW960_21000 [candidate division KSB1 bacterium]|nr:hypothetical protein [candidate division KSB1 bacterium]
MLRIIGIIITISLIGWMFFHKKEFIVIRRWLGRSAKTQFQSVRSAVVWIVAITGLVLALTGLLPFLLLGAPMSGFTLLIHVAVAPVFIAGVFIVSLMWAESHRFDAVDWETLRTCLTRQPLPNEHSGLNLWRHLFFWLMLITVLLLGSIVLSMYPLFDSIGMDFFLNLHKAAALLITVSGVAYAFVNASLPNKFLKDKYEPLSK